MHDSIQFLQAKNACFHLVIILGCLFYHLASPKLTASSPLKMDGWNTNLVSFWEFLSEFSGANLLLVSGEGREPHGCHVQVQSLNLSLGQADRCNPCWTSCSRIPSCPGSFRFDFEPRKKHNGFKTVRFILQIHGW